MIDQNTQYSPPTAVDVAVIGGGINGVGVAQAAAAAGYSVTLIEKNTLASGTSSKSSKLIHGGLRYLQQGQFRLVYESLRERAILLRIAPHLVKLNQFYVPLYKDSRFRPWQLRLGLSLYATLAGLKKDALFHQLPPEQWPELKGLVSKNLSAVFCYQDAQTDDAQLTAAVAKSAEVLGATILTNTSLTHAEKTDTGYHLTLEGHFSGQLDCKLLVNAAGPWVNQIAHRVAPTAPNLPVELIQGSHVVLDQPLSEHCYYLESPQDQRVIFALPWKGKTLLGTTEKSFTGNPDQVDASDEEITYLLHTLAHYFPEYTYREDLQIIEKMSGLRVLPATDGAPFSRSRELRLLTDDRYIALYGGKLTTYRAAAQKVLCHIRRRLGRRTKKADTAKLRLPEME